MGNNEIDLLTYFDAKFNALKEYFDEKFKHMDEKFDGLKACEEDDIKLITEKLDNHETRITELEKTDGNKARKFLENIRENFIKYSVPAFIVILVYLLGTGDLAKVLGIK